MSVAAIESRKTRSGGRNEVLTWGLARRIIKLIETMPDVGVPVSWASIETQVKKQFGNDLRRNVLSSKKWDGRALIHEAYKEAANVQRLLLKQDAPIYANSSRAVLLKEIDKLRARVLALKAELSDVRSLQYDKLDLYRTSRTDLRVLVEEHLREVEK